MSDSPVDLLRQAAEAAKNVLPVAIATLIVSEIENSGPHIKWWDDGDELGEHWRCLTCDEPMEPTEWRRGCECIGWLFAREVLALAEQQQTQAARTWRVGDDPGPDRALLVDAAEYVINGRLAAVSALQRNIRVGFAKAAWLMDLLETWGVVGPADGSKARSVLVLKEDLHGLVEAIRGGQ